MPGLESASTPRGPLFLTPTKPDAPLILMTQSTLDISLLDSSPAIVTDKHLNQINELIKKVEQKKLGWEVMTLIHLIISLIVGG